MRELSIGVFVIGVVLPEHAIKFLRHADLFLSRKSGAGNRKLSHQVQRFKVVGTNKADTRLNSVSNDRDKSWIRNFSMQVRVAPLVIALVLSALHSLAYGHGGGLNQYGCHRQSSDNTYHCHSGVLDGQVFSTEQSMIDAYQQASGGGDSQSPQPDSAPAYNRADYMSSWRDQDGNCRDTRDEVLLIESIIPATLSADGCDVLAGLWLDPYTGQQFTNPSDLDIDHMVPLAEAHESGGWRWDADKKSAYANDLHNAKALVAVSASANRSKGSRDPAQWLPTDPALQCEYVKNWVEVKRRHGLEMDVAEAAAIETVLGASIDYALRSESGGWNEGAAQSSSAVFGLGLRRTSECAYTRQASATDEIEVSISVTPDGAHLNQLFNIFLVAELPEGLFSLNPLGQFVPFTGDISSLVPFRGNVMLRESFEFNAFQGVLNEALSFNLYIGYMTGAGDFVYTQSPVRLSITP
jgi:hypothetical protein